MITEEVIFWLLVKLLAWITKNGNKTGNWRLMNENYMSNVYQNVTGASVNILAS